MFHHLVPKRCATKIGLINITNMSCAFMSCALEIKSNGRLKRAHVEFCALIPKTYLHYQSAYGHQLCHCDDLPCGAVTHISHMTLGLRGLARSHEKLKTYPHYQGAYGHYTWQDGGFSWAFPMQKVMQPFGHVVMQDTMSHIARSRDKLELYLY